jgi:hypothetical protein
MSQAFNQISNGSANIDECQQLKKEENKFPNIKTASAIAVKSAKKSVNFSNCSLVVTKEFNV